MSEFESCVVMCKRVIEYVYMHSNEVQRVLRSLDTAFICLFKYMSQCITKYLKELIHIACRQLCVSEAYCSMMNVYT